MRSLGTAILLHPASVDDALPTLVHAALALVPDVEITTGRDDYQRRIAYVDGDEDRWAYEVASDYDLFLVGGWETRRVGRRTAAVLEHAFARGRRVLLVERKIVEAGSIRTVDADDWATGWLVLPAQVSREP